MYCLMVYTYPCLPDRTNGRSPVRENHSYTTSLPTRSHKWQIAGQGKTLVHHVPAYQIAQMADRRSGKNTRTPRPCLPDRTNGRSPVRENHSYTTTLPTRSHKADRRSGKTTHTPRPCLPDRTNGRSPVREEHSYTTSLPTRSHKWQIAGQGKPLVHHVPAYQIAQMADRRSGKTTHTPRPCLPDRTNGRSPVRENHSYITTLPTRSHKWQIAGQGKPLVYHDPAYQIAQMADRRSGKTTRTPRPCLPDRTNGRSPVRENHSYTTTLPTRSHKADRRSGKTTRTPRPCLPDRTNGRSPVRENHSYTTTLPTRSHKWQIAGQGKPLVHHDPAYQIAQMADRRSGKTTRTPRPCLPDQLSL